LPAVLEEVLDAVLLTVLVAVEALEDTLIVLLLV
jgi:hypothetical protein